MKNLTADHLQDPERALKLIEALKKQGMHKDPDHICRLCKTPDNPTGLCSGPHICKECSYFPYVFGYYVGCMCRALKG